MRFPPGDTRDLVSFGERRQFQPALLSLVAVLVPVQDSENSPESRNAMQDRHFLSLTIFGGECFLYLQGIGGNGPSERTKQTSERICFALEF